MKHTKLSLTAVLSCDYGMFEIKVNDRKFKLAGVKVINSAKAETNFEADSQKLNEDERMLVDKAVEAVSSLMLDVYGIDRRRAFQNGVNNCQKVGFFTQVYQFRNDGRTLDLVDVRDGSPDIEAWEYAEYLPVMVQYCRRPENATAEDMGHVKVIQCDTLEEADDKAILLPF